MMHCQETPRQPRSIRHDPRPYYDYTETGVKGHYHGFSYGKGIYLKHNETTDWVHPPSFRVQKNSDEGTLAIHILNEELKSTLDRCTKGYSTPSTKARSVVDAVDMLSYWNDVSSKLAELKVDDKNPDLTKAFQLLLEDCLLDSRLYEGIDIPLHYASGKIPLAHRDAVQQRAVQQDIKDIDLAVDRSLKFDDVYIMAGYEPFVTPDDFPALPQLNLSATDSTEYTSASSVILEGKFEPREPIWNPLLSGRSYQKVHFSPSDTFSYSAESRRISVTDSSDSLNARDPSIGDALPSTVQARNWDSFDHCAPRSLVIGSSTDEDRTFIPPPSIYPGSSLKFGNKNHKQTSSASWVPFHRHNATNALNWSDGYLKGLERPSIDDKGVPGTWAQRLGRSLKGYLAEEDLFAPDLWSLPQNHKPWARHRSKLADNLKKRLKDTYATLAHIVALSDERSGPSAFFRTINSPLDLYRIGSSVLKKVMSNEPPRTLRQVVSCVILAECMLAASLEFECHWWYPKYMWNDTDERERFLDDLSTWSSLLRSPQDIRSFDQIALALWDWTPLAPAKRPTASNKDIEWISVLALDLTQLISKTAQKIRLDGVDDGDLETLGVIVQRMDTLRHELQINTIYVDHDERSNPGAAPDPPVWIDRFKDKYKDRLKKGHRRLSSITKEELPAPQVVLLLSGAVFAAVCSFLIAWRIGLDGRSLPNVVSRISESSETEANSIERNCVYVFLYVCLMWESMARARQLDGSNPLETMGEVPQHGGRDKTSEEAQYETSEWWMATAGVDCDENSSTEAPPPAPYTGPSSAPASSCTFVTDISRDLSTESCNESHLRPRKRLRRSHTNSQRPKIHPCRQHCGQKFTTIGNRNKHERKDCRKLGDKRARVQCQYCGKTVTRLHYAENGHLQRCREARL